MGSPPTRRRRQRRGGHPREVRRTSGRARRRADRRQWERPTMTNFATDRATAMRWLAEPAATAADFTRPGHVVPLRAKAGGVLRRAGHTEAAIDLCRLAGLRPAGVLCEIVSQKDVEDMARLDELEV